METIKTWAAEAVDAVQKDFLGDRRTVERLLVALLCRGHVLIEDVPGVGKTVLARAVARTLGGEFSHVQCTPDLLPSDILGVSIFNPKTGEFGFRKGPVMTNVLLVDEINRATPRTQSALLEAMAEGQVSVEGRSVVLPAPFFLIATQSPVESEGTFPLPEVQKDRFFLSLSLGYPERGLEARLMRERADGAAAAAGASSIERVLKLQEEVIRIHVEESLKDYILGLVSETRGDARLTLGVSPRGSLALFKGAQAMAALRGRDYATPEDVKDIAFPVLSKRILIKPQFVAKGLTEADVIRGLLDKVEVPGYK